MPRNEECRPDPVHSSVKSIFQSGSICSNFPCRECFVLFSFFSPDGYSETTGGLVCTSSSAVVLNIRPPPSPPLPCPTLPPGNLSIAIDRLLFLRTPPWTSLAAAERLDPVQRDASRLRRGCYYQPCLRLPCSPTGVATTAARVPLPSHLPP